MAYLFCEFWSNKYVWPLVLPFLRISCSALSPPLPTFTTFWGGVIE